MKKTLLLISAYTLPFIAFAQPSDRLGGTYRIFVAIKNIVTTILIPLTFTLALLMFFWGIVKYIRSAGSEKEDGKKIMVWGVVALFVMSSIWGLVSFLQGELGIGNDSSINIPTIRSN